MSDSPLWGIYEEHLSFEWQHGRPAPRVARLLVATATDEAEAERLAEKVSEQNTDVLVRVCVRKLVLTW